MGGKASHLFAFARSQGAARAVLAVPRLLTRLGLNEAGLPHQASVWLDTSVVFPSAFTGQHWLNVFTGETLLAEERQGQPSLQAAELFNCFPVALLLALTE